MTKLPKPRQEPAELRGIAVSPGIAIGTAYCLPGVSVSSTSMDSGSEVEALAELAKLQRALRDAKEELAETQRKVAQQVGAVEASIFQSHISIVTDSALLSKLQQQVRHHHLSAADAIVHVALEYEATFARVADEFLRERLADIRDVLNRVSRKLAGDGHFSENLCGPIILVADELLPSDLAMVAENDVLGVVTQQGGRTSHAAILARSYGIPAVSGVSTVLERVSPGDQLIVDGAQGIIYIHPDETTLVTYRQRRSEQSATTEALETHLSPITRSRDGVGVELMANVSSVVDAVEAARVQACGIGLFRTEFFFLRHHETPDETEEYRAYSDVIQAAPEGPVTIRTLDLGGDKTIPYLSHTAELNPFMGWRSIRISFEHEAMFLQQIRAVLRAAATSSRPVKLMFPMITVWEEWQKVRELVARAVTELETNGQAYRPCELGMMAEVPSASLTIEQFLDDVDFVSIGSNDLTQYLTAADRDNPRVSHLCQSISPAVLRVIRHVIEACDAARKPVTVCGEMAGSVRAFVPLLGMGLRSFSMSPAFIPAIHDLAAYVTLSDARQVFQELLSLRTATEMQHTIDAYIRDVRPELAHLLIQ